MESKKSMIRGVLVGALVTGILTGCDAGIQDMGATEYGVRFRKLPPVLGGGIGAPGSIAAPLESVVVLPWETLIRFDTSPQYLTWGAGVQGETTTAQVVQAEDVYTRAKDGNEAALKITVRYRINPVPEMLTRLAQEVATSNQEVRQLVIAVIRSEIRTYMNRLRTVEFRNDRKRNDTVDEALAASRARLSPLGIEVESINLKQYRFVRLLKDGTEDTSYQDRLRDIQEKEQDIQGERTRIETVRAKKHAEFSQAESAYNAQIAEATGYKEQSTYLGDSYYQAKANEAKAIEAEGKAEVEGLKQRIAALAGKGGKNMVRLEVAKQLAKANPKFIALQPGGGVEVSKTDVNDLVQQLGIFEGVASQSMRSKSTTK